MITHAESKEYAIGKQYSVLFQGSTSLHFHLGCPLTTVLLPEASEFGSNDVPLSTLPR